MSRRIDKVDALGFPVPQTFEPIQPTPKPRSPKAASWLRCALAVLGIGLVVGLVFKEQGRQYMADWYARQAKKKLLSDDMPGALADLDMALHWAPDQPEIFFQRAQYRQESQDLKGSLEDYNKLILLAPNFARAYAGRSVVYQRLEQHRRAIDDLNKAISLRPTDDHELLNHRAYTRALARLELPEALNDIQRAIELAGGEIAAYIDTRGYIYYLLDRQEDALADLDRAVTLTLTQRQFTMRRLAARNITGKELSRFKRMLDENEGVITYHRGLVHDKLGNTELAQADKRRGLELGYNPALGVY